MKKASSRSTLTNVVFLVKTAFKHSKKLFVFFGLYTLFTSIAPFIGILAPKFLIDELTNGKRSNVLIGILLIFFISSVITKYFIAYFNSAIEPLMIFVRCKFLNALEEKAMTMDFKHTENPKTLNDYNSAFLSVNNNSDGIEGVFHKLFEIAGSIISFIGYIGIVATLNPLILLYLLINVIFIYSLTLKAKKYEHDTKDERSNNSRKLNYIYSTMSDFTYGKDLRIYSLSNLLSKKYKIFSNNLVNLRKKIEFKYLKVSLLDSVLTIFSNALVYGYLIYKVLNKSISIGDFTMYFATVASFASLMKNIMDSVAHIRAQNLYINDFRNFLELEDEASPKNPVPLPSDATFEIEFKNVSFKYPNSDKYVYKGLNLKINKGQRLAIVGINGAGKTTFVKLLTRLYEPTEGEILLNGININSFERAEYYKLFSVVFQDIKLFAFTVAENIAVTTTNIDKNKVIESINKAGINEKINSLKKGIDTSVLKVLDSAGVEFSGGQNQRLALARALYKDGSIVVMDEPTAALDPIAEQNIYNSFDDLCQGKTSIYISHRLASTRFCDAIAFFEDGKIQEYGTHDELLKLNGKYADMFNVQAQYYETPVSKEVI